MGLYSDAALPSGTPDADPARPRPSLLGWVARHPRVSRYAVAAVLLGGLSVAVASSTGNWVPSTSGLPPNQAGYLWCCGATEVAATWEVPQLMPASVQSAEGVWIGLQTPSGKFFLQVGTQDNWTDASPVYEGFWSSGPLKGTPESLGTVHPGDVVSAELALSAYSRWEITFADLTEHWTHTHAVSLSANYARALAEWIEEDPAEVVPYEKAQLFVMAKTGGTRMSGLRVNGNVPGLFDLQPETFVDGSNTTFSPSRIANDSFRFVPW
jgi:hypothetical protein